MYLLNFWKKKDITLKKKKNAIDLIFDTMGLNKLSTLNLQLFDDCFFKSKEKIVSTVCKANFSEIFRLSVHFTFALYICVYIK